MATMQGADTWYMKVTNGGQISLPAEVRRRWGTTRVKVTVDGDRLVIEPAADNPIADLIGILAGPGRSYDDLDAEDRDVERERDLRRYPWLAEDGS